MVTPEHTRSAREVLGADRLLCTEQKVVLESDIDKARAIARESAALSMGLTLPVGVANRGHPAYRLAARG